jgi:hypothetical protein
MSILIHTFFNKCRSIFYKDFSKSAVLYLGLILSEFISIYKYQSICLMLGCRLINIFILLLTNYKILIINKNYTPWYQTYLYNYYTTNLYKYAYMDSIFFLLINIIIFFINIEELNCLNYYYKISFILSLFRIITNSLCWTCLDNIYKF